MGAGLIDLVEAAALAALALALLWAVRRGAAIEAHRLARLSPAERRERDADEQW
jgi:hypothetical protein